MCISIAIYYVRTCKLGSKFTYALDRCAGIASICIAVIKNFISCSLAEGAACNEQLHQTHENDLMVHKSTNGSRYTAAREISHI